MNIYYILKYSPDGCGTPLFITHNLHLAFIKYYDLIIEEIDYNNGLILEDEAKNEPYPWHLGPDVSFTLNVHTLDSDKTEAVLRPDRKNTPDEKYRYDVVFELSDYWMSCLDDADRKLYSKMLDEFNTRSLKPLMCW